MIEIDGGQKSGSGTILRLAVALAAMKGEPLHIYNIRQNRPQPGLKPQHLEAVLTAAKLCDAEVRGAHLNSRELWFAPKKIKGGRIEAEIGTAGSIPMLLTAVLPMCAFAKAAVELHITKGGTDVRQSPTANYLRFVLFPLLKRMGLDASLTIQKYGYYPKGNGEATLKVQQCKTMKSLRLESFGDIEAVKGLSVCTFLADRKVAERQAKAADNYLKSKGINAAIEMLNDRSNPLQKGSSIVLWIETDAGVVLGADAIGELGKPSEVVGTEAAERLVAEIQGRATADLHLADMLIPYFTLAEGESICLSRMFTEHMEANAWLVEKFLGRRLDIRKVDGLYRIKTEG